MGYRVKEIYHTIQGEGAQAGQAAVFLRFSGCNLWTGREQDRPKAICQFCDTDFRGIDGAHGGDYATAAQLAAAVARVADSQALPLARGDFHRVLRATAGGLGASAVVTATESDHATTGLVVCTGGEPLLQLDEELISALHDQGLRVAVETNGTRPAPAGLDWICVSPKAGAPLVQTSGNELKLVYPQADLPPEHFTGMAFDHFFLQPMDGPAQDENTRAALAYCLQHDDWRLSLQLHKILGIR